MGGGRDGSGGFNTVASGGGLLDAVSFGLQVPDFSIGRVPNGTGLWNLNLPTPAALNSAAALTVSGKAGSMEEGGQLAREALQSGSPHAKDRLW